MCLVNSLSVCLHVYPCVFFFDTAFYEHGMDYSNIETLASLHPLSNCFANLFYFDVFLLCIFCINFVHFCNHMFL